MPEGDADISGRMREIKAGFTRRIARHAERTIVTLPQQESGIWQRRFWERTIRYERDYAAHIDYIHLNPVKHGLVKEARAWNTRHFVDVWRRVYIRWNGMARRVMRFMTGSGSEVIGVTAHSSGSLRLDCVGVLEHALRLFATKDSK